MKTQEVSSASETGSVDVRLSCPRTASGASAAPADECTYRYGVPQRRRLHNCGPFVCHYSDLEQPVAAMAAATPKLAVNRAGGTKHVSPPWQLAYLEC